MIFKIKLKAAALFNGNQSDIMFKNEMREKIRNGA